MQEVQVKVQGESWKATPIIVKYTGTAAAVAKGQCLSVDLATSGNIVVTAGSEQFSLDCVKAATANTPFGGIAAKAYTLAEITANPYIEVYRSLGDVCQALVDGTQDVVVGDEMVADVSLAGLKGLNFAGAATGIAAIALEAYTTDATTALKWVMLTGQYSLVVA